MIAQGVLRLQHARFTLAAVPVLVVVLVVVLVLVVVVVVLILVAVLVVVLVIHCIFLQMIYIRQKPQS